MKKSITFESAAMAMLKSTLLEWLEIRVFNPDCIYTKESVFRKKIKLACVKSAISPTKYGTVESSKGEMQTIGDSYVNLPTPGRKNHYRDVSITVDVEIDPVSENELMKEFDGNLSPSELEDIQNDVQDASTSIEGEMTALCRMEMVKFGNVWSPVSVTATIDGKKEWDDFLSEYDTADCSLPRNARIDESKPEFADDFKELLAL